MRRNQILILGCLFIGAIATLSCSIPFIAKNNSTDNDSAEIVQTITPTPTEQDALPIHSDQDTTLGGSVDDPALIFIPAGAFEMDIAAEISYTDVLPAQPGEGWTGLSTPMKLEL